MPSDVLESRSQPMPGNAAAPRFGAVMSLSKSGNHRLAYTEWGDPGAARTAICVHGLTRQGRDFDPLALALAGQGYRVLCPDLPGRGRSDWLLDPSDYDLQQYVADMVMLLARAGAAKVDWIGTSLGGLIGFQMASMRRSPIRRMVINDVGPLLPAQALLRFGKYLSSMPESFADLPAAEAYFREILAPYGALSDREWVHLTTHSVSRRDDGRYRLLVDPGIGHVFRNVMYVSVSMWRQWDAVCCPVLILRGAESDLLTPEIAREMGRRGPPSTLVEIPGVGHAPTLMEPSQIDTIVHWLTRDAH